MGRRTPGRIGTVASALALLFGVAPALAQDEGPGPGPDQGPDEGQEEIGPDRAQPDERLFVPFDDELADALRRVDDLAARGQWDRVVELLDKLLLEGRDELEPSADDGATLRGVRAAVRARLAALPAEGRAVYAQLHDDAALRLLESARDRASLAPLLEVVARHPGSRAVFAARTLLASRFLERGQPAAALAQLDALLERPGLDPADHERLERARVVALSLLGRAGEAESALARLTGDVTDLQARVAAIARAHERPAAAAPEKPATKAWAQPVLGYYEVNADGGATRPWSVPEVDQDRVYVHDGSHALAVDLATGKLAWRVALRPEDAFKRPAHEGDHRVLLAPGLVVCLVPGVGVIGLERETGRERWRRGLPGLKRDAELDFPAQLSGDLCLTGPRVTLALVTEHETREVHVLALEVETGALAWTALVASQSQGLPPQVELAGTDERVVVITGLGLVVALDQEGEVVWARRYESARDERDRRGGGGIPGMPRLGPDGELDAPADAPERAPSSLVVRGSVWGAPADAKKIWAWDLRTGEVEAVLAQPERARLVAARGVELVLLSGDGDVHVATKAGASLVAQVGGVLVGWPALAGDRVYVPRVDGVIEVDLKTRAGRKVAPAGREWGHLVGAGGLIVSGAPSGLFAFGRDPGAPAPPALDDPLALLGSPSFAAREVATAALAAQGEAARAALARASGEATDPEVRQRARGLVSELDRKDRLARWGPIVKPEWATQIPDLLTRLTHPNPEVRLESLRELGALTDTEVGKLLSALLDDHDERVVYAVAAALLLRGDRAGVDRLARAVATGLRADRLDALRSLGAHGKPEDVERCAPGLAAEDDEVRAAAVTAVLALDSGRAMPLVEPLVKDPADEVRIALLEGVARAPKHPASVRVVVALSRDKNDMVRLLAVTALAKTPDSSTFGALGHLLGDNVPAIAQQALVALNAVAQKAHVLMIPADAIERAARGKDTQFRDHVAQIAVRYLGRGGVLSVPTLTGFISDEEKQIRGWMVGGRSWQTLLLAHVAEFPLSPGDVAAVGSLIGHEEADVRIKGYQVLGTAIFAPGAGALLAQGLDDDHPQIRRECARWLTRREAPPELVDDAAAHEVLRIAALSPRAEGQTAAAAVLDRVPRPVLVPALLRALAVPNEVLRAAAGARLAKLSGGAPAFDAAADAVEVARAFHTWWWRETHPGETLDDVVRRLEHENPTLRWRAAQTLATLPTPHARNALAASLAREQLGWVLEGKLEALATVLGEPLGFVKKGLTPAEQRACADRLRLRVVEQIQEELRQDASRRGAPR